MKAVFRQVDVPADLLRFFKPAACGNCFVCKMVRVFREIRRVLRDDGTCWLNLGDSFSSGGRGGNTSERSDSFHGQGYREEMVGSRKDTPGLGPKQLLMMPHRVALALQADGWNVRDAVIWSKADMDDDDVLEGSAMPGSQKDRCTFAYEMLFQLVKSQRYYFDMEAIKSKSGAMPRNVWRINPEPWSGAHFATYPRALVERCVKAGTSAKGVCPKCGSQWEREIEYKGAPRNGYFNDERQACVKAGHGKHAGFVNGAALASHREANPPRQLGWRPTCSCPAHDPIPATVFDPFCGSGTTGVVATGLHRNFIGVDLSPNYCRMAMKRINRPHASHRTARNEDHPLFAGMT
jgi:DNA modification methylase